MKKVLQFFSVLLLFFSSMVHSSLENLNSKLPVEIEDAEPMDTGTWNVQTLTEYKQEKGDEGAWKIAPELRTGIADRFQLTVRSPILTGPSNERTGSGDVESELQYLLIKSENRANIGLSFTAIAPTGKNSHGLDSEAKIAVSQDLYSKNHRLHLNFSYDHNQQPAKGEQRNFTQSAIGYSGLLHQRLLFLIDFVHNKQKDSVATKNYGESGIRYQLTKRLIGGAGLSVGKDILLGRAGLQYDF